MWRRVSRAPRHDVCRTAHGRGPKLFALPLDACAWGGVHMIRAHGHVWGAGLRVSQGLRAVQRVPRTPGEAQALPHEQPVHIYAPLTLPLPLPVLCPPPTPHAPLPSLWGGACLILVTDLWSYQPLTSQFFFLRFVLIASDLAPHEGRNL